MKNERQRERVLFGGQERHRRNCMCQQSSGSTFGQPSASCGWAPFPSTFTSCCHHHRRVTERVRKRKVEPETERSGNDTHLYDGRPVGEPWGVLSKNRYRPLSFPRKSPGWPKGVAAGNQTINQTVPRGGASGSRSTTITIRAFNLRSETQPMFLS